MGNGQDAFFKEEAGKTSFSIFVKFLRPVIKDERFDENEPIPSTSRNLRDFNSLTIKTEVEDNESVPAAASTSMASKAKGLKAMAINTNDNMRQQSNDEGTKSKIVPKQKQKNKPGPKCSKMSRLPRKQPSLSMADIDALKDSEDPGYLLAFYGIKGEEGVNFLLDQRTTDPGNVKLYEEMIVLLLNVK